MKTQIYTNTTLEGRTKTPSQKKENREKAAKEGEMSKTDKTFTEMGFPTVLRHKSVWC